MSSIGVRMVLASVAVAVLAWVANPQELAARQVASSRMAATSLDISAKDSTRIRRRVESEVAAFLVQWRRSWLATFSARDANGLVVQQSASGGSGATVNTASASAPRSGGAGRSLISDADMIGQALPSSMRRRVVATGMLPRTLGSGPSGRMMFLHCHPLNDSAEGVEFDYPSGYAPLVASPSRFGKCPIWLLGTVVGDEADDIDVALRPATRDSVRRMRSALIARLDAAQDTLPGDAFVFGQRIRFRVDQHELAGATEQVSTCEIGDWWCATLAGYVFARAGRIADADSAFGLALAVLPEEQACSWGDIRALVDNSAQSHLSGLACAQRISVAAQYWWLSDPLFVTRGNERRVEHFARKTMVLLHSALAQDERNSWRADDGGGVVSAMMVRYGWPTFASWFGQQVDLGHTNYLQGRGSSAAEPYTTAEYSYGRVQFAPSWRAVLEPFAATPALWELAAPEGKGSGWGERGLWWPMEHMRYRDGAMLQLPAGQMGIFRRQTRNQLIMAVDLEQRGDTFRSDEWIPLRADESNTTLFASTSPDSATIVARQRGSSVRRLLLDGSLPLQPSVISLEMIGTGPMKSAARTRFGLTPPAPLSALPANTIAASDPVLFAPSANGSLPEDVDAMKPMMLGRTFVRGVKQIGIFWETYGVPAGDSVRIAVNVSPASDPNLLRRIGGALRLLDRPADGVAIEWRDASAVRATTGTTRDVPIYPRSLAINIEQLPKGDYWIDVAVSAIGRGMATGRSALTIR